MRKDAWFDAICLSFKVVYKSGINAPPAIPMISNAAPVLVNLPNPSMASGKIAGHINALAMPRSAIKMMAVYPVEKNTPKQKITPNTAEIARAFCC